MWSFTSSTSSSVTTSFPCFHTCAGLLIAALSCAVHTIPPNPPHAIEKKPCAWPKVWLNLYSCWFCILFLLCLHQYCSVLGTSFALQQVYLFFFIIPRVKLQLPLQDDNGSCNTYSQTLWGTLHYDHDYTPSADFVCRSTCLPCMPSYTGVSLSTLHVDSPSPCHAVSDSRVIVPVWQVVRPGAQPPQQGPGLALLQGLLGEKLQPVAQYLLRHRTTRNITINVYKIISVLIQTLLWFSLSKSFWCCPSSDHEVEERSSWLWCRRGTYLNVKRDVGCGPTFGGRVGWIMCREGD